MLGLATLVALIAGASGCSSDPDASDPGQAPAAPSAASSLPPAVSSSPPAPSGVRTSEPSREPDTPITPDTPDTPDTPLPTVPARPQDLAPPAPIDQPAEVSDGVVVSVVRSEPVETQGVGPGESSGEPAVAVTLRVQNGSARPLDLIGASVTMTAGPDRVPARTTNGPPSRPWQGRLAPGESAEGVYVFAVEPADRADVVLRVTVDPGEPTLQLTGPLR